MTGVRGKSTYIFDVWIIENARSIFDRNFYAFNWYRRGGGNFKAVHDFIMWIPEFYENHLPNTKARRRCAGKLSRRAVSLVVVAKLRIGEEFELRYRTSRVRERREAYITHCSLRPFRIVCEWVSRNDEDIDEWWRARFLCEENRGGWCWRRRVWQNYCT